MGDAMDDWHEAHWELRRRLEQERVTTMTATTAAAKPKRTRTVFTMPQRLTTDGSVSVTANGDYIRIAATDAEGDTADLTVSEYGALCLLRKLAEQLKVTMPSAFIAKIKATEPREPKPLKGGD